MAALLMRRGIWIGSGFLILALSLSAFASFVAGQRLANSPLASQFEDFTGRRVVMHTSPVIRIYPALSAEFRDVSFHNRGYASNNFPVLEAPVIRLTFSVFAALMGETRVTSVKLELPVFRAKAEDGTWQGLFSNQAALAKQFTVFIAKLPNATDSNIIADILDQAPGPITIVGGTIILDRVATDTISDINGQLVWMPGSRNGQMKAEGIWRGEPAKVEINTDDVAMMFAGYAAGVRMAFSSNPINASFTGITRLVPTPYFEGAVFAKSASLSAAAKWQGFALPFDFDAFSLNLSGFFKGDADKWQLEDSRLQLGSNNGTGSVIYQPNATPPRLSGTLDFESLDLGMLGHIFDLRPNVKQPHEPVFSTDLRISANAATFGVTTLNMVAASLQVSKDATALDIHDAAAFGGTLQMSFKSQNNIENELRILADNIEIQSLSQLSPLFKDLPQTRGSISAILRGSNIVDTQFVETAQGTVKIRLGAGSIAGVSANQLVRELRKGGFFALKADTPSLFSFSEIDAEASLAQGTLQFDTLRLGLDKAVLSLTGAYAVKDQSMALTGTLDLDEGHPEAINGAERLSVFFGGNRNAPLMSSLSQNATTK